MKENLSKKEVNINSAVEESVLDWGIVLKELEINFGKDIYNSWIANINLIKEFNHYEIGRAHV